MKTKNLLIVGAVFWTGVAVLVNDIAAIYISLAAHGIIWFLHRIEIKLNKLLDNQGFFVSEQELSEWRCQTNSNQSQRFQKVHILRCTNITPLSQRSSTFLLIGPSGF